MHEHEVPEGLAHLHSLKSHEAHVHPVLDERFARHGLALGRFALVVRKREVATSTVHVERDTEFSQRQSRALNVPTRSTRPPARLPPRLVFE